MPDLAAAYGELQNIVIASSGVNEFLHDLAVLASAVVAPISSCGITLRRDGRLMTVAADGETADLVDELQYARGTGPCLQALRTGQIVIVTNLEREDRWGDYPVHALAHGVRGSLSIPLLAEGDSVGALNLYTSKAHEFTADEIRQGSAFADQASGALSLVVRQVGQANLEAQLREALASRSVIDQAIGVIMAQQHVSAQDAFSVLRTASQHQNVRLHAVATDLVLERTGFPAQRARPFVQRV